MAETDLYETAVELLGACYVALGDRAPARVYVAPGAPAWDCCPQLTVHVGGPVIASTLSGPGAVADGHRVTVTGILDIVTFTVTVIRCSPSFGQSEDSVDPPSPAEFDAVAQDTNADLWAIWNYLAEAKRQEVLFAPREREFMLDPAVSLSQAGGCVGWQIPVRVSVYGYRPAVEPVAT